MKIGGNLYILWKYGEFINFAEIGGDMQYASLAQEMDAPVYGTAAGLSCSVSVVLSN